MPISARIIAHSISSETGITLATIEVTIPRIILPEISKHRVFSLSTESSRARPFSITISEVEERPFVPEFWGAAVPGMNGDAPLSEGKEKAAAFIWREAALDAAARARHLSEAGVCKGLVNRLIEPFLFSRIVISSTKWANFFALRLGENVEPHMRATARAIEEALLASVPKPLSPGEWHLPTIDETDPATQLLSLAERQWLSAGRIARVSYGCFSAADEIRVSIARGKTLEYARPMHAVPFEHIATPDAERRGFAALAGRWKNEREHGNFHGWRQLRKQLQGHETAEAV